MSHVSKFISETEVVLVSFVLVLFVCTLPYNSNAKVYRYKVEILLFETASASGEAELLSNIKSHNAF